MDKTFCKGYEDGQSKIGDKLIDIVGDNIFIDDEVYIGTPGLWSLITYITPQEYNEKDYERYKENNNTVNIPTKLIK